MSAVWHNSFGTKDLLCSLANGANVLGLVGLTFYSSSAKKKTTQQIPHERVFVERVWIFVLRQAASVRSETLAGFAAKVCWPS